MTLLLVLIAFTFSCGGQWYALQCVAWVNMIREYSQAVPLSQAVEMTFSGRYPCSLCQAIAHKKQSENMKMATGAKQEKKSCTSNLVVVSPPRPTSPLVFRSGTDFFETRSDAPPTPPPRFA